MGSSPFSLGGGGGAPPGPQLATALQALAGKQASGGADAGQDLSKLFAENQSADPGMILRQLEAVQKVLSVCFTKSFQVQPELAGDISDVMKKMNKALKTAQKGQQITDAIGSGQDATGPQPISFSPAGIGLQARDPGQSS